MNKKSDQKRKMLRAVVAVLELYRLVWQDTAGAAEALADLVAYLAGIDRAQRLQAEPVNPWTAQRRAQRRALIGLMVAVVARLRQHAHKQNLPELLNAAVINVRAVTVQRQSTTLAEAERVGVLATPYAAIFEPTKAGAPNRLVQLTAAAAAFRVELETKRQREVKRGTGTRGIHANATQATRALAELDDLLSPYREENPEFFAAYEQARQLIDEGVRTTDATAEGGKEVTQSKAA